MNKNGFTIMELLAVIIIIGIIGTVAGFGVNFLLKSSNEKEYQAKKELLIEAAILYGEEHSLNEECMISGYNRKCKLITIQDLIDENYFSPQDKCGNTKCVINNVTKEKLNDKVVKVYLINGNINALIES